MIDNYKNVVLSNGTQTLRQLENFRLVDNNVQIRAVKKEFSFKLQQDLTSEEKEEAKQASGMFDGLGWYFTMTETSCVFCGVCCFVWLTSENLINPPPRSEQWTGVAWCSSLVWPAWKTPRGTIRTFLAIETLPTKTKSGVEIKFLLFTASYWLCNLPLLFSTIAKLRSALAHPWRNGETRWYMLF